MYKSCIEYDGQVERCSVLHVLQFKRDDDVTYSVWRHSRTVHAEADEEADSIETSGIVLTGVRRTFVNVDITPIASEPVRAVAPSKSQIIALIVRLPLFTFKRV